MASWESKRFVFRIGACLAVLSGVATGSATVSGTSQGPKVLPSPKPSDATWRVSARITPARQRGRHAAHCSVMEVREWVRIWCEGFRVAAITHLGGPSANERLWLKPPDARGLPTAGGAVFSLGSLEARALLFWTLGDGYDGPLTVIPAVVVQVHNLDGPPVVLMHDALHEPVRTAASEKRRHEKHDAELDPPSP